MSEETPNLDPSNPQPPPTQAPPGQTQNPSPVPEGGFSKEQKDKKLIAGILAIVVGAFGVHKFVLGYTVEGIIMLVVGLAGFLLCGFPTMAVAIVGIVEGILYLTKTDDEFVSTYVVGRRAWF